MTPPDNEHTRLEPDDATRLASGTEGSAREVAAVTSSSGWLSSSDAIDHGRFTPGTLLGGRYRIVERLGRGGMGEVYRADDLKLGQAVALKFLPAEVDRDPSRLMQLHNEVRMARQVSHPNVCRVYDIDEVDGHTFLSMEYVDGEELASVLRRFGRFSPDRGVELARQICAGLAAAHERGVVHRDLKPANVMLDSTGRVRITDFGLSGLAGEAVRGGTPAYMAPEQIAGGQATPQSDIYALGLVLYELFTGQRAFEARTVAELLRKREEGALPPSHVVPELDASLDRAILRCLELEPGARPSSALAVAAALPGGDPLAAALAAGETPSPEMVAASGSTSALKPLPAVAGIAASLLGLLAVAALSDGALLTSHVPLQKPPDVLMDRSDEIARALGYTDAPADRAFGFEPAGDYLRFARERGDVRATRDRLRSGQPAGLFFWLRTSPRDMVPTGSDETVTLDNPPLTVTSMRVVKVDTQGRLTEFHSIPPELEVLENRAAPADWTQLFGLAGLDRAQFKPSTPQWAPAMHSDERAAWTGPVPGWPEQQLRVEAAAYRGRVVSFQMIYPWTRPARMEESPVSRSRQWREVIVGIVLIVVLGAAVLVARHNLRKGRGDRRGAFRIAVLVFTIGMIVWLVGSAHFASVNVEIDRLFTAIGEALFSAGMLWVLYLALEPYVRKFWPKTLISWSRLVAGNYLDPHVGRDILLGALFAILVVLLGRVEHQIRPFVGLPEMPPIVPNIAHLEGTGRMLTFVAEMVFAALFNSLWIVFGLVAVNLVARRVWITAVIMCGFLVITALGNIAEAPPIWFSTLFVLGVVFCIVFIMFRFGLLAAMTLFFVNFALAQAVLTLDASKWFFGSSVTLLVLLALLPAYGFYASRGGEPLLGRRILE